MCNPNFNPYASTDPKMEALKEIFVGLQKLVAMDPDNYHLPLYDKDGVTVDVTDVAHHFIDEWNF